MLNRSDIKRTKLILEDTEQDKNDPEWVATIYFGEPEVDDTMEDAPTEEIVVNAPDFDTAAKYVSQYVRKMQMDEATKDKWADANILAVQLR